MVVIFGAGAPMRIKNTSSLLGPSFLWIKNFGYAAWGDLFDG
jgi:hypothetical protein